jgi:SAM-dependent methyltransferase
MYRRACQRDFMTPDLAPDLPPLAATPCPGCGAKTTKPALLTCADAQGAPLSLYRCPDCDTAFYHPAPTPDYSHHTASPLAMRDYVEAGAGIDLLARLALRALRGRRPGRILDVGCGFGFTLDFARRSLGWTPRGVEPSTYGRVGARLLGLPIDHRLLEIRSSGEPASDAVFSSEVIEHVPDPDAFLDILVSHLSDDGVLVVTTPDRAQIRAGTDASALLAILSPGFHLSFLPAQVLAAKLRDRGLVHSTVENVGLSIAVYASRMPLALDPAADLMPVMADYYIAAAAAVRGRTRRWRPWDIARRRSLEQGMLFRAYWALGQAGAWERAAAIFPSLRWVGPRRLDDLHDMNQFAAAMPIFLPALAYMRAIELLVGRSDFAEARNIFSWAARLCVRKEQLHPQASVLESDLLPRAYFHEALAASYLGDWQAVPALLGRIGSRIPADLPPRIQALQAEAARALSATTSSSAA